MVLGLKFLGIAGYGFLDRLSVLLQVRQFSPAFFEVCKWIREHLPGSLQFKKEIFEKVVFFPNSLEFSLLLFGRTLEELANI